MIKFLNSFEIPAGRDDEFLALWRIVNEVMVTKPGYVGHVLHRSLAPDARYRFVNYVTWESVEHHRAAHDAAFRALVSAPEWKPFSSNPALYEVVSENRR